MISAASTPDNAGDVAKGTSENVSIELLAGTEQWSYDIGDRRERRDHARIKAAYHERDGAASRQAHQTGAVDVAAETHNRGGDYVKSMVYGAMDGIQTTFAVIAGAAGAELGVHVILILGCANLLANALAMGMGDTISEIAEIKYIRNEMAREQWEYDHYKEGEIREMEEIFQQKGMNQRDASRVVQIMAKYGTYFVNTMMTQELDLELPGEINQAYLNGLVTFASFVVFGFMPLSVYIIFDHPVFHFSYYAMFTMSIAVTGVTMAVLGAVKARFSNQSAIMSAVEMLLIGAVAAAASYGIAFAVQSMVGSAGMC